MPKKTTTAQRKAKNLARLNKSALVCSQDAKFTRKIVTQPHVNHQLRRLLGIRHQQTKLTNCNPQLLLEALTAARSPTRDALALSTTRFQDVAIDRRHG